MEKKLGYGLLLGGAIRYLLSLSTYSKSIENRVEVSTPLNSFKRREFHLSIDKVFLWINPIAVREGVFLYNNAVDPYDGDIFHENPLLLVSSSFLLNHLSEFVPIILILLDLLSAVFIYHAAKNFTKKNVRSFNKFETSLRSLCVFLVRDSTKGGCNLCWEHRRHSDAGRGYRKHPVLLCSSLYFQPLRNSELRGINNNHLE